MSKPDLKIWGLSYDAAGLRWDDCSLIDIARQQGTPLYVVNPARLEDSYRKFAGAFSETGMPIDIFFSVKTNPLPTILRRLERLGAGFEVISEYEFYLAQKLGISVKRIIVNGPVKSDQLLSSAVKSGAMLINVEGIDELKRLMEICGETRMQANVGLRINPGLSGGRLDFTTSTGSRSCQIGIVPGSDEWRAALNLMKGNAALNLRGIHFHIGSGIMSATPYSKAVAVALAAWKDALEAELKPEMLDIGGGFNIETLKELSLWGAIRLLGWSKAPRPPAGSSKYLPGLVADTCIRQLNNFSRKNRIPIPRIIAEPGRALCGSAMLLLLTVKKVSDGDGKRWIALCDGGAMSLSTLLLSEYHTVVLAIRASGGQTRKYDLRGNLPTPLDIVSLGCELPTLSPGDVIAVLDTGAYFLSLGNNFAGPRPAVVMIENGTARVCRKRESFDDLASRDSEA